MKKINITFHLGLVVVIAFLVNSFMYFKLFNWLVVPMFGLTTTTFWGGVAILAIVVASGRIPKRSEIEEEEIETYSLKWLTDSIYVLVLRAFVALSIGWVASKFI